MGYIRAEIAVKAGCIDLPADERVVLFAVGQFMAAWDASGMEVADDIKVGQDFGQDIAFHDAAMIDVIEGFDRR